MAALREGFTTGSCALACCLRQRDGLPFAGVSDGAGGRGIYPPVIIPHADGSCGVIKDSGNDLDIANGMEVVARVEVLSQDGPMCSAQGKASARWRKWGSKFLLESLRLIPCHGR